MTKTQTVSALVTGGKASAGPPLGPALGPLGINIVEVIDSINKKTKDFVGMKVPITVNIELDTKKWDVGVGIPSTASLILKESGISKGTSNNKEKWVANISLDNIIKISKIKINSSYSNSLKCVTKEVLGTCLSAGIKVNGKTPKDIISEINSSKWEEKFKTS